MSTSSMMAPVRRASGTRRDHGNQTGRAVHLKGFAHQRLGAVEIVELGSVPPLTRVQGKTEAFIVKKAFSGSIGQRCNHRQFMFSQLEAELMFFQDLLVGWRFIFSRKGFLALQIIFAVVNFCGSITYAVFTPMILEIAEADTLGFIGSIMGAGFLTGTLILSVWGGPKRRIYGTYIFESLIGISLLLTGLARTIPWIVAAQLLSALAMPITNGCTQAMWQSKVPQDMQGRVFSARPMISFSIIPLAYLLSGPLSENFFIPAMSEGGALAARFGQLLGTGPERGIGLMYVVFGLLYFLAAQAIILYPRLRWIELELPDAVELPS